jgi:hypothetical protein
MAAEGDAKDLKAHERSYGRFISMMRWGTGVSVVTALIVILIIGN